MRNSTFIFPLLFTSFRYSLHTLYIISVTMSQVKNEIAFAESEAIRTEDPCYVLGTILRILLLPVGLAAGAAVVGFSAHPFTVFRTNPTPDPGRNPWPKYFKMRATYSMIASGALALFLNSVALVALVRCSVCQARGDYMELML